MSIVDTISRYVALDKVMGADFIAYMGLCPFHKEKTSSFSVNADVGSFHCFGCGLNGGEGDFLVKAAAVFELSDDEKVSLLTYLSKKSQVVIDECVNATQNHHSINLNLMVVSDLIEFLKGCDKDALIYSCPPEMPAERKHGYYVCQARYIEVPDANGKEIVKKTVYLDSLDPE